MSDDSQRQPQRQCRTRRRLPFVAAAVAAVAVVLTYTVMFGDGHLIWVFAGKEQLFEQLSALFLFLADALALGAFVRCGRRPDAGPLRRYVFLLLTLLFFVACGEELSWGQHYFGYSTPETIQEVNQQEELNLHNLWFLDSYSDEGRKTGWSALFTSNRLFDYFMLGLFVLAPLVHRVSPPVRRWVERLGVPVPPAVLGVPLLLNLAFTVAMEKWIVDGAFRHLAVSEIRECNYAFLCLAGMLAFFILEGPAQPTSGAAPESR
jgi:hypothetical protein